ncbi:hypothetical protein J2Z31_001733 [Sinorhizobium kostiense]|uniref:Uncharacterized protein n=1 Tax=Sinorhizobium kostiense TaxID=76747 RepID=A0ABS4QYL2_9HYPH|nr:hypothetical protein [Sinorhizobium kostiense]
MTATIERPENEDDDCQDCPGWGEWWPEALEQRELDNADAEVPSPLKPLF